MFLDQSKNSSPKILFYPDTGADSPKLPKWTEEGLGDFIFSYEMPDEILPNQIISVETNSFAIVDMNNYDSDKARYILSTGYLECIGAIARVVDDKGKVHKWAHSHFVIDGDPVENANSFIDGIEASPGQRIKIDLVGGYRNFMNSEAFYESFIDSLVKRDYVTIDQDLRFKDMLTRWVGVDLHTGIKVAFAPYVDCQANVMEALYRLLGNESRGPCHDFKIKAQGKNLARFDWEICNDQMWSNFRRLKSDVQKMCESIDENSWWGRL